MKNIPISNIISAVKGELISGGSTGTINNIFFVPQYIRNNTLYFNFYKKLKFDYNAIAKKNSSVIVTDTLEGFENLNPDITLIKVKSINKAYFDFIDYYRSQFNIPVIGVTGTCGKTTTKEMLKHILSAKYNNIVATYKSQNQLPFNLQYLVKISDDTQIAAIEMGVTDPDDLLVYCRYFKPQIGIITNIGVDHLKGCKTIPNYIRAKAKFLEGLGNKGTLILNSDCENIKKIDMKNYQGKIIYFGFNTSADFRGYDLKVVEKGLQFTLKNNNRHYKVFIPVFGDINAYNSMAAIAAANEVGISIDEAVERLKTFVNVERHLQVHNGIKGSTIIDDTWSSNPTSAEAAIRMLKSFSKGKKTAAVLGRMNLLGDQNIEFHLQLGKKVAELGINYLITTDGTSKYIGIGASEAGMSKKNIYICSDINEILSTLTNLVDENTVVLVKSSMIDSYEGLINKLVQKE